MARSEPFSLVYDTIVNEFKTDYKNVVSYDTVRLPKPDVVTESDLPELTVLPDQSMMMLGFASCESTVDFTFQVAVRTGDQRLDKIAFPVMWKLLKAYFRLRYGVLDELKFNDRKFVVDISLGSATLDLGAAERGAFGWAFLWPITVQMAFAASDLGA